METEKEILKAMLLLANALNYSSTSKEKLIVEIQKLMGK